MWFWACADVVVSRAVLYVFLWWYDADFVGVLGVCLCVAVLLWGFCGFVSLVVVGVAVFFRVFFVGVFRAGGLFVGCVRCGVKSLCAAWVVGGFRYKRRCVGVACLLIGGSGWGWCWVLRCGRVPVLCVICGVCVGGCWCGLFWVKCAVLFWVVRVVSMSIFRVVYLLCFECFVLV